MALGTIILPILAAVPDPTNPPALGFSTTDNVPYLIFDETSDEICYWSLRLPENYATPGTTPKVQIQWSNAASDTGNVYWGCEVSAVTPNSDTQNMTSARSYGTINNVADAGVATARLQEVELALTTANGAVAGDQVVLKFRRDASDALDTMNTDEAYLWAVSLEYTTS